MVAARQGGSELDSLTPTSLEMLMARTKAYFGLHRLRHLAHIPADSLCSCGETQERGDVLLLGRHLGTHRQTGVSAFS